MLNSFGARGTLRVGDRSFTLYRLDALAKQGLRPERLPFCLRVLLENMLRNEDGKAVREADVRALCDWAPREDPSREIAFTPSRVVLQDFTGVPLVVDLAAMRDAMRRLGGDPNKINPLQPVDLVVDHSVQVDVAGSASALGENAKLEFQRNRERYEFLRWGQKAFQNFRLVPPATGIVHQVNLEYLAPVVFTNKAVGASDVVVYPDSVIGTDSHTTMINGLGVLGWGVGGIEAEASMLGQPLSMLIPNVIGFELKGSLPTGATATDLVLTVTEILRKKGVVGKFVEFFGEGVTNLPVADRATIGNMAPEYGATCGIFPIDKETIKYLELSGRPKELVALVEAYYREQRMFGPEAMAKVEYSDTLSLDLGTVVPSLAGPKRPQDRVPLAGSKAAWQKALAAMQAGAPTKKALPVAPAGGAAAAADAGPDASSLTHGSVVIAAITSCTNTSNPSVMLAAGLLAQKAAEAGLSTKPWVKASLAPGSKVVTDYLRDAGVLPSLEALRFNVVGYGCTTCIGNSGPLPESVSAAINEKDLVAVSVLSGNRNFEGRVHPEVRANYLASPPLVVAYALAGTMDIDLEKEPLGTGTNGKPVYLKDVWPSRAEVDAAVGKAVKSALFEKEYAEVFKGDEQWQSIAGIEGETYPWDASSTYVQNPPYFQNTEKTPTPFVDIEKARVLAVLGDSITTDHISPAGSIKEQGPAGVYLSGHGVAKADFNSYGSRRGNHEVMMRGTFANIRLRNRLAPGTEGGVTRYLPGGEVTSIFEASEKYRAAGVPTVVLAGKEYGSGSSRDWAAKGPALLGIRAVIAESFERIHRSNLVGMGVIPLQFTEGQGVESLGLTGEEVFTIEGVAAGLKAGFAGGREVSVRAAREGGPPVTFRATVRIDTPQEVKYVEHGGILPFVLRQLLS